MIASGIIGSDVVEKKLEKGLSLANAIAETSQN